MPAAPPASLASDHLIEAMEVLSDGMAVFDADGRCVAWNARYADVWAKWRVTLRVGASFSELLRAGAAAGRYPEAEDVEAWIDTQVQSLSGPVVTEIREEFGQRLRFETRRTRSGGFVATCATELQPAESVAGQGFLDTVVANVPAMLFVKHGETGQFLLVNRTAEEMLGVSQSEFLGKNDADFFPLEQAEKFAADDRRVIESGQLVTIEEEPLDTPHRGRRWLQTRKIAVPFGDGRRHLLIISEDITERKASAAALAEALERAEAASIAKSEFLANMSHEIRTPLNGVLGMAEVLSRTLEDTQQREMMEVILSSGRTLSLLLTDILDLSKIEAGALELTDESIDLREAVTVAVAVFEAVAQEKGVGFNLAFAPGFQDHVIGDALRIRQIVGNLASNAVKFTASGAVNIWAETRPERGGRVALTVTIRDSGAGFDAAVGESLFERFQQVDGSVTRKFAGSGLGLPIARKLARLMGGDINCTGERDVGATFVFEAVLAPSQPQAIKPAPLAPQDVTGRHLRVLLAEDHPTNQQVIVLMLQGLADVTIAGDGRAAVDAFESGEYDVILMDTQMPVLDGLGAMSAIRARERLLGAKRTPIISLTANAMPHQVAACTAAGADLHLAKPVSIDGLIAALQAALDAEDASAEQARN